MNCLFFFHKFWFFHITCYSLEMYYQVLIVAMRKIVQLISALKYKISKRWKEKRVLKHFFYFLMLCEVLNIYTEWVSQTEKNVADVKRVKEKQQKLSLMSEFVIMCHLWGKGFEEWRVFEILLEKFLQLLGNDYVLYFRLPPWEIPSVFFFGNIVVCLITFHVQNSIFFHRLDDWLKLFNILFCFLKQFMWGNTMQVRHQLSHKLCT